MKRSNIFLFFSLFTVGFFFLTQVTSCTHDDDVLGTIDPSTFEYGDDVVSSTDGYNFDKTHSSVRWESAYLANSALLTGRFNDFTAEIEFEEDKPENLSFYGNVILSTVNTGEPGRDQGCLMGTFDIATSDEAMLVSKSATFDNQGGYNVKADLTFHGVTSEVDVKLNYSGTTNFDENSGIFGAPLNLAGFTAEFQMNAKTIFGIESGNIADIVTVRLNIQFKEPL